MDLELSKNLGGVGSILIVIGGLATFGMPYAGFLALIGIILVLIAAKGLADFYSEARIFNNALYALIMEIIGAIAFVGIAVFSLFQALADLGLDISDLANVTSTIQQHITSGDVSFALQFVGTIILAWVVLSALIIISAIFYRKSLTQLSAKTRVGMFGTAGMLMLIGGILFIIFIGALLIWVSWILIAVAFFSIRVQPTQPQAQPQPPPPSTSV